MWSLSFHLSTGLQGKCNMATISSHQIKAQKKHQILWIEMSNVILCFILSLLSQRENVKRLCVKQLDVMSLNLTTDMTVKVSVYWFFFLESRICSLGLHMPDFKKLFTQPHFIQTRWLTLRDKKKKKRFKFKNTVRIY